jgi:hypothetical protein
MEAASSSETLMAMYQTTYCHSQSMNRLCLGNLKGYTCDYRLGSMPDQCMLIMVCEVACLIGVFEIEWLLWVAG